jgi:hypothetical protein
VDASGLARVMLREQARAGALDGRREMARRCLEGKQQACDELIAGRLTLAEAADRFERLDALLDDGQDELAGAFTGVRGRAEAAASVIHWVSTSRHVAPARRAEVLARLQRERARLTGASEQSARTGAVTTPPAGPTRRG